MDYILDIYQKADEEHSIEFSYEQLVDKKSVGQSFLSLGTPAKEWATRTNTYIPPMFVITLTPYKDIVRKAQNLQLDRLEPVLVEYDEIKVPKVAAIVENKEQYPIITWEEYGDEDKRGKYPTVDMNTVRGLIEKAIAEFKRTREYNVITPNMGCDQVWEDPAELKKILA